MTAAYRKLANIYHLHKYNEFCEFTEEEDTETFKNISNAYEDFKFQIFLLMFHNCLSLSVEH